MRTFPSHTKPGRPRIHCAAFLYPDTSVSVMLGTANGPTADSFRAKNTGVVLRTVLNKDGAFSKILARYDEGPSSYVLAASDGSKGGGHYPFPLLPFFELSPDGSHAVLVTTRIHGSDSALAAVVVLNARGDTVAAREIAIDGVPIPRQVVDSAISGVVSRMPSRALAAEYARQVYVPAVYPPVVNVRVGNNGDVWIKLYSSGPSSQYRILRVSGEIMSVSGPSELDLLAVSDEVAWGVIVDDVGVPSLVRLRIRS